MLRSFRPLFAVVLAIVSFAPPVLAQNAILYVSPNRVTFAPEENITVLNVTNQSEDERRYDLTIVEQVMTPEGMTQRLPEFEYSAKRMLRYVPKRFTLKPGERQTVRVMATRKPNLPDGDYHSHLLFREIPVGTETKDDVEAARDGKQVQFDIRAIYGVAVPLIVQNGTIDSDLKLGEASYIQAVDGAPEHLAVNFMRTGNAEASGRLTVEFKPQTGEPITLVNDLWVPVYREVDTVTKRFPVKGIKGGLRGGKMVFTLSKPDMTNEGKVVEETKEMQF